MKRSLRILLIVLSLILVGLIVFYPVRHAAVAAQVRKEISTASFSKIQDMGSTSKLAILPVFDKAASREDLIAAHGVSYLVITDHARILFDLGFDPDTLQHNMQQLGVSREDFDIIVISHDHPDHVGGHLWWPDHTFSLGKTQEDLGDLPVYVPERLTYPGITPVVSHAPQKIAAGVAIMGTIPFEEVYKPSPGSYIRGEQALAVNVEGLGLVLISGCGHPGVQNMLDRAAMLFDLPVVGMVGGLHFTDQKIDTLKDDIEVLQAQPLRLLGISPHDSQPETIQIFREAFPNIYQDIAVGQEITLEK